MLGQVQVPLRALCCTFILFVSVCTKHSSQALSPRTPIELVKCKMQVQMLMTPVSTAAGTSAGPHKLPGPIAVLTSVVREHGLRGLWLGHTGTLLRETGGGAAWFAAKEGAATLLLARRGADRREPLHAWESAAGGACAGVA